MSIYGEKFDKLAERWKAFEAEHDSVHPERSQCGGVGGCTMMAHAHDLKAQMIEQLEAWRVLAGLQRTANEGKQLVALIDGDGDRFTRRGEDIYTYDSGGDAIYTRAEIEKVPDVTEVWE